MSKLVSNPLVRIDPDAVVCSECELVGEVVIGPQCVVHTRARIIAEAGPIIIGEGNLIEEQSLITNKTTTSSSDSPHVMHIGNYNVFEVGSVCEAVRVGDHNTLECKSSVGSGVLIGSGCVIGAGCRLKHAERLPDKTVVFGGGDGCQRRRLQTDRPPPQTLQLDHLRRVLPDHHYLAVTRK